jgi:hypothetical protein
MNKQYRLISIFLIVVTTAVFGCACERSSSSSNEQTEMFSAEDLKNLWNESEELTHPADSKPVDLNVSSRKRPERIEPISLELFEKMKRVRTPMPFLPNDDTIFAQNALQSIAEDKASIETIKDLFERIPKLDFQSNFSLIAAASETVKWAEREADTRWTELNELSDHGKKIIYSYLLSLYCHAPHLGRTFNKKGDFNVLEQDLINKWQLIRLSRGKKIINTVQVHLNLRLPSRF